MYTNARGDLNIPKIVIHAVIALVALVLLFGSFGNVATGTRGVKTRFGAVVGIISPGLYFKIPLVDHVTTMDVHTQSLTATKDAPLSAASNDLQDTRLAVVVNYHIAPTLVSDIFTQYGGADDYYIGVVDPLIVATIKSVASEYTASDQIQKRQEMSDKVLASLQTEFADKNVVIEKADITDISFSDTFTAAIEAKVTAQQNAEAAKNKLAQVTYEGQQTIVTAQAVAEAQRIQSQALAAAGGSDYVQLKAIEKWNGVLPAQMIPGSTVPFVNLKN